MKDGRPSLLWDIRYFVGPEYPPRYLDGHRDVIAYGRRMAWLLNSEGVSLGAYHSLYLSFCPAAKDGQISVTEDGGDWWQRYTYIGVPNEFPKLENSSDIAIRGTLAALIAIRPDAKKEIEAAHQAATTHGEKLRFLIKSKTYKRYVVEIAATIAAWPSPSLLYIVLNDRETGAVREAEPVPVTFYDDAFNLAGRISLTKTEVKITANRGLHARMLGEAHGGPIVHNLTCLKEQDLQAFCTKSVKRPR